MLSLMSCSCKDMCVVKHVIQFCVINRKYNTICIAHIMYPLVNKNKMLSKIKSTTEIPVAAQNTVAVSHCASVCRNEKRMRETWQLSRTGGIG